MKLSVAAIVKNEADTLLEWIAYHRVIGVEKFFIADNESTDDTSDILAALAKAGLVSYLRYRTPEHGNVQIPAYTALLPAIQGNCDIVAFIDADEYLTPLDGSNSLLPLLERMFADPNVSALGLNWATFGSGGALFAEEGLVTDRFTKRAKQSFGVNFHIKTIARPEFIQSFANPHYFNLKNGRYINAIGQDITPHPKHGKGLSSEVVWEGARINHYATKSLEEFLLGKSKRGSATKQARVKHKKYFTSHDRNDEEDASALRLSSLVTSEYQRLKLLVENATEQKRNATLSTSKWRAFTKRLLKRSP